MLPPYIPSAAEKADPVLYAANIRKLIVSGLLVGLEHYVVVCSDSSKCRSSCCISEVAYGLELTKLSAEPAIGA
jgi:hypothetical protein